MNNQKKMGNKGFSLVELIVVIAIMAVLVGVLAPQFIRYVEKSRQSGDMTSIQELMTAVETGVSDGTITSNATIGISGTTATVGSGVDLSESGLGNSATLKSTGWPAVTFTYDVSTFTWSANVQSAKNSKKPQLDMLNVINKASASN